jgi:hypothetical protein
MTLAQKLRQEGRQEGRMISLRENVLEVLAVRFGAVPKGLGEALTVVADEERLRALLRSAGQCGSLEEFSAGL